MSAEARISVVIPTYYRNGYLTETIESVLAQSPLPEEIIVVDDSGEEHARSVVEGYDHVQYVPLSENRGGQVARNVGYEHSTGEYVQFLDDDDRLLPGKLAKQIEILESSPEVGVVYCGARTEAGTEALPDPDHRGDVLADVLTFQLSVCSTSTMLIRRELLEQTHPLEPYSGAQDNAMKVELAKLTEFEFVPEVLVYRGEPDRTVGHSRDAIEGRFRLIEEYADEYDRLPASVRNTALAKTYFFAGFIYVEEGVWSLQAVRAFALATYYSPEVRWHYVFALVLSLFGKAGWSVGQAVNRAKRGFFEERVEPTSSKVDAP